MQRKYIVLREFLDIEDGFYPYNAGDVYPRTGYTPSDTRIEALSTSSNASGVPMITTEVEGSASSRKKKKPT